MQADIPLKKLKNRLSVSTLSSQFWCEKAVELSFTHKVPETEVMARGRTRHKELHEETAELIPVKVVSIADSIGLGFHNMLVGLIRVKEKAQTRELPVFGWLPRLNIPLFGHIDELLVEDNRTKVIDHKTRKSDRMPTRAQTRVTEFQLMSYYSLLKTIQSETFDFRKILECYNLDSNSTFTDEFLDELGPNEKPLEKNLLKLTIMINEAAKIIPELSKDLEIIYENQDTKKLIGKHTFQFDAERWKRDIEFATQYWLGERPAMLVGKRNRWKCNFCAFKSESICPIWKE
ncbi:MAG: PD-(D/E)XK nuclease family protein [Candidatus Bathyarchaeia archaeon]